MRKSIATLIDEISITNIKIYYLEEKFKKNKRSKELAKKLQNLKQYHSEIFKGLSTAKPIKKSIGTLIDELSITNIKIFILVDRVQKNKHTKKDAKKLQDLNSHRSELASSINKKFQEKGFIKV